MTSYFKQDNPTYEKARQEYLKDLYNRVGYISCSVCGKTAAIKLWNKFYSIDGDVQIHHVETRGAHHDKEGDKKNFCPLCSKHHDKINVEGKDANEPNNESGRV